MATSEQAVDRQAIADLITKHEGFRATRYADTTGHMTIGVGFNLDAPGAQARCEAAGLNYDALRAGAAITRAQSDALMGEGIQSAIDCATVLVKGFQALPANAQLVLIDMIFNLGAAGFARFRPLIAALEAQSWNAAAEAIRVSLWYREVGTRAKDDIDLILSCNSAPQKFAAVAGEPGASSPSVTAGG